MQSFRTKLKKQSLITALFITFYSMPLVQIVSAQSTVCNDNEVQVSYDTKSSKYHKYLVENEICSVGVNGCSRDSVFKAMLSQANFVAPTDDKTAVKNCKIINVNLPVFGIDSVRTLVDEKNYKITNYTRKNHFLHPGRVTRTIIEQNKKILVTTFGEGTGLLPSLNEKFAPNTWNDVDKQLIQAIRK